MKNKTFLTIIILTFPILALAQTLNIHKTDGSVLEVEFSAIDSITFTTYGTPCQGTPTVTYGGKTYNTVQIGNQCWLKENLDVGTMIDSLQNASDNRVIEKYCYSNDPNNCLIYGGLYQWDEVMQYVTTEGAQGICPSGWHIPTEAELQTLIDAVNDSSTIYGGGANSLKAIGQGTGDGAGTNTSGFSALFAGYRDYNNGSFSSLSYGTTFWSSAVGGSYAYYMDLGYDNSNVYLIHHYKNYGFSVRCLKD